MCVLSYLDASLKDYDLINKFFFKNSILGSFMFRVLYLYIPGVSTSSSSYSGSQSLYSGLFTFISFIFQVPNSEQFFFEFFAFIFWVLYPYILGSIPLHSGFSTSLFRFYLPLYSGFSILGLFQTPHPGAELQAGFSINPASQSPSISVSQSAGFSA